MTNLRCLIVDDEAPARDELRFLLSQIDGIDVVGSAATADEALVLIESVNYDLVFLDIRMPGRSGLDLAAELRRRPNGPQIIFTTAYPDHAVDAFELSAADYLLKPFSLERLVDSIDRTRDAPSAGPGPQPTPPPAAAKANRLPVQQGDRTTLIDPGAVIVASAAHGYTYLLVGTDRMLTNYSLADLEQRFGSMFFRVHRSHLVNLDHVRELRSDFRGGLVVITDDPNATRIPVARRQANQLRQRLGL